MSSASESKQLKSKIHKFNGVYLYVRKRDLSNFFLSFSIIVLVAFYKTLFNSLIQKIISFKKLPSSRN